MNIKGKTFNINKLIIIGFVMLFLAIGSLFLLKQYSYATDFPGVEEQTVEGPEADTMVYLKQVEDPQPTPTPTPEHGDKSGTNTKTGDATIPYIALACSIFAVALGLLNSSLIARNKKQIKELRLDTNTQFSNNQKILSSINNNLTVLNKQNKADIRKGKNN